MKLFLLTILAASLFGQAVTNNKPNTDKGEPVIVVNFAMSPYTVSAGDRYIRCDATAGAVILNFPATSGGVRSIEVKKVDATTNACTPTRAGADLIDGATTKPMIVQWEALTFKDGLAGRWDIEPRSACADIVDASINCNSTTVINNMQFFASCLGLIGGANPQTYFLVPGGSAANTCLGNTATIGNPVARTCVAKNLFVIAGAGSAAGTNASAVTIYSGATGATSTGITCSLDGATSCNDTTHTYTMTVGGATGIWSIGVSTGQAVDTIASVRASFQCQ